MRASLSAAPSQVKKTNSRAWERGLPARGNGAASRRAAAWERGHPWERGLPARGNGGCGVLPRRRPCLDWRDWRDLRDLRDWRPSRPSLFSTFQPFNLSTFQPFNRPWRNRPRRGACGRIRAHVNASTGFSVPRRHLRRHRRNNRRSRITGRGRAGARRRGMEMVSAFQMAWSRNDRRRGVLDRALGAAARS